MAKEIVAMILAGGRGSRLYALTQKTAKLRQRILRLKKAVTLKVH